MPIRYGHLWISKKVAPVKPGQDEIDAYGMEAPLEMHYEPRKIRLPEKMTDGETFKVRKYHIDTNEHVNNASMYRWRWKL